MLKISINLSIDTPHNLAKAIANCDSLGLYLLFHAKDFSKVISPLVISGETGKSYFLVKLFILTTSNDIFKPYIDFIL